MFSGRYDTYRWIVWNVQCLGDLITTFPDIVRTKYIVITSFDSGRLILSASEQERGWYTSDDFAYSPRITQLADLPYDHYDEWYVFEQQTLLASAEIFINYSGFRLQPDGNESLRSSNSDSQASMSHLQQRFWQQLKQINPETYVAEGDNLIFVTRNHELFERVQQSKLPKVERR